MGIMVYTFLWLMQMQIYNINRMSRHMLEAGVRAAGGSGPLCVSASIPQPQTACCRRVCCSLVRGHSAPRELVWAV